MEKIQAVLFDLGNTLSRSASLSESMAGLIGSPIAQRFNLGRQQMHKIGVEINQQITDLYRVERPDQPDWRQVWNAGIKNAGLKLSSDEVEHFCRAHLSEFLKNCELEPYSFPLLKNIRKLNIPLGLVSNVTGPVEIFEMDLIDKGLAIFFQTIVWSSGVGFRKPNPRIFQIALDDLNQVSGKQIIMVGDNEIADIIGGKNMGFTTVKVDDNQEKSESIADYVVLRSELEELFEKELLWR